MLNGVSGDDGADGGVVAGGFAVGTNLLRRRVRNFQATSAVVNVALVLLMRALTRVNDEAQRAHLLPLPHPPPPCTGIN